MYGTSLMQIWQPFHDVLVFAEDLIQERSYEKPGREWEPKLRESLERLLYVLFEHLEDCANIVQSCFPSVAESAKNGFAKANRASVADYRDRLGRVVNAMKHEQGRLRFIVFFAASFVAPGYFVEGVFPNGMLGPNPNVHNKKSSAAFSLAYDLRLHFCILVLLSRNLCKTVERILGSPDREAPLATNDPQLWDIATRLTRFSRIIFPDEFALGFPGVETLSVTGEPTIRVTHPSSVVQPRRPTEPFGMRLSYIGDGATQMFAMPYTQIDPAYIDSAG